MVDPASNPIEHRRVKVEVVFDHETRERLREQAEREHRSSQGVIRALVDQHLTDARRQGEVTR